jgi:hypothetical protein
MKGVSELLKIIFCIVFFPIAICVYVLYLLVKNA